MVCIKSHTKKCFFDCKRSHCGLVQLHLSFEHCTNSFQSLFYCSESLKIANKVTGMCASCVFNRKKYQKTTQGTQKNSILNDPQINEYWILECKKESKQLRTKNISLILKSFVKLTSHF